MLGRKHRAAGAVDISLPVAAIVCVAAVIANPATAATYACPVVPPPLSPPTDDDQAATLLADQVALNNGIAFATGHVRLEQNTQALEAPRLRYNRKNATVHAENGIKYIRPGLYLTAQTAQVHINNNTGTFSSADYTLVSSRGRGQAAHAKVIGDGRYVLTDASYTTCSGATKAWLLTASSIELNKKTGRGEAYNSVLHFFGLPVLYLPYMNFPIDDRRHTGFLVPTYGSSSDSGYELALPYYINLAPNYDATIIPRLLTERGVQISGQLRYLTAHHRGEIEGSWLPSDNKYGANRGLIDYEHTGKLARHWGIQARFSAVTDNDYFDDLDTYLAETSESHLQRSLKLSYENTGVSFSILAEGFQNLNPYDSGPYERLPQIRLALKSPTAPFYAGIETEYTAFTDDNNIDARRLDLRPHVNWAVDHGGWYANAEAALHYTHYNFADEPSAATLSGESIERSIPVFSFGGGLRFVREAGDGWLQTLEPRFLYLYKGYEDQDQIHLFDTAIPDLNFGRLFQADRFTGKDRITDANQITLGVTSRLIDADNGNTVLKFELGRIFAFEAPRVHLPNRMQALETGYNDSGSDYFAGVTFTPGEHFSTGAIVQYDPKTQDLDRAVAHVRYRHDSGFRIRLAWRRYEDFRPMPRNSNQPGPAETLEQIQVALATPLGNSVNAFGQWAYSLAKDKSVTIQAGLEYRPSCCWATRVSWLHQINDSDGSYDTAFQFQIILRGLASFGKSGLQ